ncbi:NBS-LRR type resistance protein [Cucumis melo var. makuwa]|uniref:NBS-LRR type resistance protein n=1 Tax=Cucumis melo var. makuwa TaxID=1194695 RepID=A0A5D3C9N5_CUCMM|nr:NBS-LRR type resistance protein [Cucumis melo var. makuwa]
MQYSNHRTQNHKTKYSEHDSIQQEKITNKKIHQRKNKENQTRPYGLHASFLLLVGLPLAVPLPEKLKKRKGEYKIYPNAHISLVIPNDARISLVTSKDTPIRLVIPKDAHISLVIPKDAHISLVIPKDGRISLVIPKDTPIRKEIHDRWRFVVDCLANDAAEGDWGSADTVRRRTHDSIRLRETEREIGNGWGCGERTLEL